MWFKLVLSLSTPAFSAAFMYEDCCSFTFLVWDCQELSWEGDE